jgi:hypothetical protein
VYKASPAHQALRFPIQSMPVRCAGSASPVRQVHQSPIGRTLISGEITQIEDDSVPESEEILTEAEVDVIHRAVASGQFPVASEFKTDN